MQARQRGVSLIELMIGMAIGLLAVLVMTQVTLVFEGRKRATSSGSDAQVNGALALQALQREIQMAGYGMTSSSGAGCTLRGRRGSTVPPWDGQPMVGVRITPGADGAPDTLDLLQSNPRGVAVPVRITEDQRRDATAFIVGTNSYLGLAEGDLMVAVPNPAPTGPQVSPGHCVVFSLSAPPAGNTLAHTTGTPSGAWNQDPTDTLLPGSLNADISYAAGSHLVNLGTLRHRRYSLRNDTLCVAGFDSTTGLFSTASTAGEACHDSADPTRADVYPQIVNLQAVYGIDTSTPRDNSVDRWSETAPTDWSRAVAVRLAVVARSNQYEGKPGDVASRPTAAEPTWRPDGLTDTTLRVQGLVACPATDTDCWRHYRYRVFETVVPLRNMLWQS